MSPHTTIVLTVGDHAGNAAKLDQCAESQAARLARRRIEKAAPDLLALLIKAVQSTGPFGDDTRPPWFNDACAAIAKVTAS